jgi:hypothetical protein
MKRSKKQVFGKKLVTSPSGEKPASKHKKQKAKETTYLRKITQTCQDAMHFKAQIRNWDLGKNQKHENERKLHI